MLRQFSISIIVASVLLLEGCDPVSIAMLATPVAENAGLLAVKKSQIDYMSKGSSDITVDVSSLSDAQKKQIRGIESIAVWPDRTGNSVSLAEYLSKDRSLTVISPAHVSVKLHDLGLTDDLKLMTSTDIQNAFSSVSKAEKADAVISVMETGSDTNPQLLSAGTRTTRYIGSMYVGDSIVNIPIIVKASLDHVPPPPNEMAMLVNSKLAASIIDLITGQNETHNKTVGQK